MHIIFWVTNYDISPEIRVYTCTCSYVQFVQEIISPCCVQRVGHAIVAMGRMKVMGGAEGEKAESQPGGAAP